MTLNLIESVGDEEQALCSSNKSKPDKFHIQQSQDLLASGAISSVKQQEKPDETVEGIDGGYGWIVVVAVFFVHVFVVGPIYSFGIFYRVYLDYFKASESSVAWIGSIGAGLLGALGFCTGKLADAYGNSKTIFIGGVLISAGFFLASFSTELWQLYLTQGVITGAGYSFTYIPAVAVVGPWFKKYRALALGIAVAGSGLGQFVISVVTGTLLERFSWRTTLKILALIEISGLTICSLIIRRKTPLLNENKICTSVNRKSFHHFTDQNFNCLYFSGLLVTLGLFIPFTYLPSYAIQYGISKASAVFLLSMTGIASASGRVLTGYLADKLGKLLMLQVCYICGSISTFCWLFCYNLNSLLLFGCFYGFFIGGVISLMPSVATDIYGTGKIASMLGILYTSTAVGNLLSSPIGGFLLQSYHSYGPPIFASATFQLGGFLIVLFIKMPNKLPENKILPTMDPMDTESGKINANNEVNRDELNEVALKEQWKEDVSLFSVSKEEKHLQLVDVGETLG
jgi:MFS family permease